jgi:PPK2 family polyphosphate:nucleotide phosphotransferase
MENEGIMKEIYNRYLVKPGKRVDLKDWDPNDKTLFPAGKAIGKEKLIELNVKLDRLQELLYAEHKNKLLVVLQALDSGGKDGTIRHVFEGVNPQGVRVSSFKVPTQEESDHDYLWRVHKQTPGNGEIVIFNRSHYEDVLVVRVHNLVPQKVWSKRYEHIRNFEKMLSDEGTTILKFYLHIDKNEQKERFQARIDESDKNWKFSFGDLKERKLWDKYMSAYEDVLSKTSTPYAPWFVIPSNRKWYRNLLIGSILIKALQDLKMSFPEPEGDLSKVVIK